MKTNHEKADDLVEEFWDNIWHGRPMDIMKETERLMKLRGEEEEFEKYFGREWRRQNERTNA